MIKTQPIAAKSKISNKLESFDFKKFDGLSFRQNEYRHEAGIWDVIETSSEFYKPENGDGHRRAVSEIICDNPQITREGLCLLLAGEITSEEAEAFDWESLGTTQPETVAVEATKENGWGELE